MSNCWLSLRAVACLKTSVHRGCDLGLFVLVLLLHFMASEDLKLTEF